MRVGVFVAAGVLSARALSAGTLWRMALCEAGSEAEQAECCIEADVLARTVSRVGDAAAATALLGVLRNAAGDAAHDGSSTAFAAFCKAVRYEMTAESVTHLLKSGDLVVTEAGTSTASVAQGYKTDDAATADVNEEFNGAGRVFMRQTSTVKARNS